MAGARRDAGGTDASLDERFARPDVLDGFKRLLAGLDAVRITNSGFRLCDNFYSAKPQPSSQALADEVADRTRTVFQRYLRVSSPCFPRPVPVIVDLPHFVKALPRLSSPSPA